MTNELTFTPHSLFENVAFDKNADCWYFYFSNQILASSSGFWRLLIENKIEFVSLDHQQQFGLPKPLDLVEELKRKLTGKHLTKIEVIKDTFDLVLSLTSGHRLEIYISSSGYETYDFSIDNKRYIGLGQGGIAIIDNPK
ncbi:MAG: hypothetical protein J0H55_00015 [Chitinophagaceae bacterium]|nr:hypothetical protein [Chitinophagaceae bacterium]